MSLLSTLDCDLQAGVRLCLLCGREWPDYTVMLPVCPECRERLTETRIEAA